MTEKENENSIELGVEKIVSGNAVELNGDGTLVEKIRIGSKLEKVRKVVDAIENGGYGAFPLIVISIISNAEFFLNEQNLNLFVRLVIAGFVLGTAWLNGEKIMSRRNEQNKREEMLFDFYKGHKTILEQSGEEVDSLLSDNNLKNALAKTGSARVAEDVFWQAEAATVDILVLATFIITAAVAISFITQTEIPNPTFDYQSPLLSILILAMVARVGIIAEKVRYKKKIKTVFAPLEAKMQESEKAQETLAQWRGRNENLEKQTTAADLLPFEEQLFIEAEETVNKIFKSDS